MQTIYRTIFAPVCKNPNYCTSVQEPKLLHQCARAQTIAPASKQDLVFAPACHPINQKHSHKNNIILEKEVQGPEICTGRILSARPGP